MVFLWPVSQETGFFYPLPPTTYSLYTIPMSRPSMLILIGVLTILAPFSGLPVSFRTLLTIIFGACVLGIGLSLRVNKE